MAFDMTLLWRLLPHVHDEHIQSLGLPLPDSCMRGYQLYSLYCKLPESGAALCLLNLNRVSDASFMVMRYRPGGLEPGHTQPSRETGLGWCFLDLKARRWYIAEDKDQKPRLHSGGVGVGMDADLACQYLSVKAIVDNPTTDFVYNPFAKTLNEVPPTPNIASSTQYFVELNMVIDSNDLENFKLFFVNPSLHQKISETGDPIMYLEDPFMHVYHSTTNFWQSVSKPPLINLVNIDSFHMSKSVMFQGHMYIMLSFPDRREHLLWRFNLSENAWENVAVDIPGELFMPKLIVSANRLFLVGWWQELLSESKFHVSEINISALTRATVLEWKKSRVKELFKIITVGETVTEKFFKVSRGEVFKRIVCPSINAFGFDSSIMFMSVSSGKSMVYDVEEHSLDQLHQYPLGDTPDNSDPWVGKKCINLLQPNTIWWQEHLLWTWQDAGS